MSEHYLIGRYRWMLEAGGHSLSKQSKVLDFCCGAGSCVRAFRADGYDVVGFEPFRGFAPDSPEFMTWNWGYPRVPNSGPDASEDWKLARLPYPDGHFDFIFSQEVMEHVSDHDAVMAELSRVTKADGAQIHTFPGCWQLVEPHVKIPLGGIIKTFLWYYLWDLLGWRGDTLLDCSRSQRVRHRLRYAKTSLRYRSTRFFMRLGRKCFFESKFIPQLWERGRVPPIRSFWLYTRTKHVVWFLSRPRHSSSATDPA